MSSYAVSKKNPRAPRRLLSHCALLGRALKRRVPARRRLEKALGREQALTLIRALNGDQRLARRRGRRVTSSP
jgi:hypothetical protein